jgi:hypothetical protein
VSIKKKNVKLGTGVLVSSMGDRLAVVAKSEGVVTRLIRYGNNAKFGNVALPQNASISDHEISIYRLNTKKMNQNDRTGNIVCIRKK